MTEPDPVNTAEPPAKAGSDRLVVLAILTLAIVAAAGSWAAVVALKHHRNPWMSFRKISVD